MEDKMALLMDTHIKTQHADYQFGFGHFKAMLYITYSAPDFSLKTTILTTITNEK